MFGLLTRLFGRRPATRKPRPATRLTVHPLEAREVPTGLSIGGHPVTQTKADYLAYTRYLTVPEDQQASPVFAGTNMAAIKKLEDPLRRQIFNAMDNNPVRSFNFPDLHAAGQNFDLRLRVIEFMNQVGHQDDPAVNTLGLDFQYYDGDTPPTANPAYWKPVPSSGPLPSRGFYYQGPNAYDAIMSITKAPFVGECLGTAEIAILFATADLIGKAAFNQMFPTGLWFGPEQMPQPRSVMKVLPQQYYEAATGKIWTRAMVPGDFVYMKNRDDYYAKTNGTGYWNGENAIYMGQYDAIRQGVPVYRVGATRRFSGLGLYDQSTRQLRQELWEGYSHDVLNYPDGAKLPPLPPNHGIRWTVNAGPGTTPY